MTYLTKAEFIDQIYKTKLEGLLRPIEDEYSQCKKSFKNDITITIVLLIVAIAGIIIYNILRHDNLSIFCALFTLSYLIIKYTISHYKIKKLIKKEILPKILATFGNLYISENHKAITLSEIQQIGLFYRSTSKSDDDIIVGYRDGVNFLIDECKLQHTERHGKSSHTVTDFEGLIVKVQMHKKFNGLTVLADKNDIHKIRGCEKVELESDTFMSNREIYSTDQIEARYLLTPSFMERLMKLENTFDLDQEKSQDIDSDNIFIKMGNTIFAPQRTAVIFKEGYIYLFIPKYTDFFEVPINFSGSLLVPDYYYTIYAQITSILDVIELFKFNQKLGL